MKRKNLSNQESAKIGRSLFKSVQQNKTELDEIFDSPALFNSIRREVYQEQSVFSPTRNSLWLIGYGLASVLVIGLLLTSALYFVNSLIKVADDSVSGSQSEGIFQPFEEESTSEYNPQRFIKNKKTKSINRPQMIGKETRKSPLKPTQIKKAIPKTKKSSLENNSPFYAINGANNFDLQNEGISVVRADFSREELSAMGIEVLNDIGSYRVKAEVLVGDDGQPRAIRILK